MIAAAESLTNQDGTNTLLMSPLMYDTFSLRPTREADADFCRVLFTLVRTDELRAHDWDAAVREQFMAPQYAAHQAHLAADAGAIDRIVQAGARPIGRLVVFRRVDELHVADISLLPDWRRHGIGTRLLTDLQAEARAAGAALRLFCQRTNPAAHLYRRLGFVEDGGNGTHLRLAWRPETSR
jgi:ribosomal protein S18 acetylase RimI-like enzyme